MTVLLAGSGSVGHMSPVVSVAEQMVGLGYDVILATDKGSQFSDVFESVEGSSVVSIQCGKYRRYPGMKISPWYRFKIFAENIFDLARTGVGIISSLILIRKNKPDAIFLKGGAISVPIGIAAKLLKVPFVTHDSDTIPGLSNRVVGRWAVRNLVNGPIENYKYPKEKSIQVGIPLRSQFIKFAKSDNEQVKAWDVLFVGGSQGSVAINDAAIELSKQRPDLAVANLCGRGNAQKELPYNLKQYEFIDNPAELISSSKLVVTRSSATFVAELATLKKTCVFAPHPGLSDQKSNARLIESKKAGQVLYQTDGFVGRVVSECEKTLDLDSHIFDSYGDRLHDLFAAEDATEKVIKIIDQVALAESGGV